MLIAMNMLHRSVPVHDVPMAVVIDLVNEFGDEPRRAAGEADDPYPQPELPADLRAPTASLVRTANLLHPLFGDPTTAPGTLNTLAQELGLVHRFDPQVRLRWHRPASTDPLRAAAAAAVIAFVADHGVHRLGICGADACVDAYTDVSQGANRRYCSSRCRTRDRVARWRRGQTFRANAETPGT